LIGRFDVTDLHGKLRRGRSKLLLKEKLYLQSNDLTLTASRQVLTAVALIALVSV